MPLPQAALRKIAEIRAELDHPIIDADGHMLESVPMLLERVDAEAGPAAAERLVAAIPGLFNGRGSVEEGISRGPWWPSVTDAEYQAAVMIPALLAEQLEEIGIDFTILYPSLGLALCTLPDADTRIPAVHALNTMLAEICKSSSYRLTPAAVIPMHTPEEAVAELRHVRQELGVAVTTHGAVGARYLPDGRGSPTNYSYNHVLGHGYLQSELCRALVYGGVPSRFPRLSFGFLEGGAAWAMALLASLVEHWEKRGPEGLANYDPSRLDQGRLAEILRSHGFPVQPPEMIGDPSREPWARDEFEDSGLSGPADIARIFGEQFAFGCESDDLSVHRALDGSGNKRGVALRPVFSSDIGHWDVPQLTDPVPSSWKLVESGRLSRPGYRQFTFELPARLHLAMNPAFFAGTSVEAATGSLLA